MLGRLVDHLELWSPSSRRAWIEILQTAQQEQLIAVALLAEGVDRNEKGEQGNVWELSSPSSRRAWIEIMRFGLLPISDLLVALLAEGVDRNYEALNNGLRILASPSSRRAWIEILVPAHWQPSPRCRPPRGGRG